jgi:hypothetical protein
MKTAIALLTLASFGGALAVAQTPTAPDTKTTKKTKKKHHSKKKSGDAAATPATK